METPAIVNDYASVIQTSLAPVFLLAGTGAFVGIYNTRLNRVSDRLNEVVEKAESREMRKRQLAYLRRRILALEIAAMLGVIAGLCTCMAILNLLSGALAIRVRPENLSWFFGGAIVSLMLSLMAFLCELVGAGLSMLQQIRRNRGRKDDPV